VGLSVRTAVSLVGPTRCEDARGPPLTDCPHDQGRITIRRERQATVAPRDGNYNNPCSNPGQPADVRQCSRTAP